MNAVEIEVRRVGRRYAAVVRTSVLTCVGIASLCEGSVRHGGVLAVLTAVLGVWSVVFHANAGRAWVIPVDTAMVAGLCLTQAWTVPAPLLGDGMNWVLAVVSATAVAHQWYTTTAGGFAVTAAVVLAYLVGTMPVAPDFWASEVPIGLWTFVEAANSRLLFVLVRAGARAADRDADARARARRATAISAARRADEREQLAALHDSAASTLLAVGTRMVDGREPWLAEQAIRNLRILSAHSGPGDVEVDLIRLLTNVLAYSPVRVEVRSPAELRLPGEPAVAMCRAVREALTNVARHAGVGTASLVILRGDPVVVEVADQGQGFEPARVSPYRRGLSMSIVERMERVGGAATVTTRSPGGTRVRLEWPHG